MRIILTAFLQAESICAIQQQGTIQHTYVRSILANITFNMRNTKYLGDVVIPPPDRKVVFEKNIFVR